uniref:Rab-GAP TBC domain-containing protein n=1 Tax=Kalanchoe fedtschenkoi TaxID=63787 RepID=A0A7N0UZF6_KALFE
MMLKLPEKAKRVFPNRVARARNKDGEVVCGGGADSGFEFGEELETIQPNGFESQKGSDGDDDGEIESETEARVRHEKEGSVSSGSVRISDVLAADEKRSDLEFELSQREINFEKLQRIASTGLPDGGSLRATTWKLLLGYLSPNHDLWEKELAENRSKYAKLKEETLISPSVLTIKKNEEIDPSEIKPVDLNANIAGPLRRRKVSHDDHPLNLGTSSVWHQYFQYTEIAEQIDRDLQRTHPDMKFFSGETSLSRKNRESMRNILLLFAKLNPAIRYVQGMNEVLAPLIYVFSTDTDEQNAANAEADSFACFVRILSDSVDHFCQQLDNSPAGIHATLSRLSDILRVNDEELWRHLEYTTKVNPQFYAFRWITLLLTQEFDFRSILRIWDSLLSNPFGIQVR